MNYQFIQPFINWESFIKKITSLCVLLGFIQTISFINIMQFVQIHSPFIYFLYYCCSLPHPTLSKKKLFVVFFINLSNSWGQKTRHCQTDAFLGVEDKIFSQPKSMCSEKYQNQKAVVNVYEVNLSFHVSSSCPDVQTTVTVVTFN